MTPRTLFNIILKILGLLFIKDFLVTIPQLLSVGLYFTKSDSVAEGVWTLALTLCTWLAYGLVAYYLIFKAELIIDRLKLDKGFNQATIPLHIHRSTVLSISIIVIGGLLVVNEIPNFCRQLFLYFQEKRLTHGQTTPTLSYSIISGVKIIIGLFLMAGQRQLVSLIEWKRKI